MNSIDMKKFLSNIRKEVESLPVSAWGMAKFAFLVGGILLILGGFAWYHAKITTALVVGIPGFLLFSAGAIIPEQLTKPYRLWMWLAFFLGSIVGPVILALIYYLIVTPIAIIALLVKGNPLEKEAKKGSYWIPRTDVWNKEGMERMF
jgi:hypothetical protein